MDMTIPLVKRTSPEEKIKIRESERSEHDLWDFILLNAFTEGAVKESALALTERLAEKFGRLSENKIIFASIGDAVVGYLAYSVWPNTEVAEIKDYKIDYSSAEIDILNALLMQAQKDARKCGVKYIQVVASPAEREWYEQMGFTRAEPGTPGEMQRRTDA